MRIFFDRYFEFFHRPLRGWMELELTEPTPLEEVLARLGIPSAETYLVVVNGQVYSPQGLVVHPEDVVQIFPPIGGG
jgi:sulfur carrier protein ThiS